MADTKISALTAVSSVDATDEFASAEAGASKKVTGQQLADFVSPAASDTVAGKIEIATQTEQETGTDTTRAVTPGRQHFHPSAAKFWAYAGVAADLDAGYNMTSVADTGTGILGGTIATDFSSAVWAGFVSILDTATGKWGAANTTGCCFTAQAAGTFEVRNSTIMDEFAASVANTNIVDPVQWAVIGFGDL